MEFAIILAELTDLDDTMELLNKIKQCAARTIKLDGAELPIAFSIGVARFPEHAQDDGDLIKAADSAMYVAKRSGNPGWSFFWKRDLMQFYSALNNRYRPRDRGDCYFGARMRVRAGGNQRRADCF